MRIGSLIQSQQKRKELQALIAISTLESYYFQVGVIPRYVELIFSWDILKVVIFTVDFKTKQDLELFKDSLSLEFRKSNQFYIKDQLIVRFELAKSIELWLVNLQDNYRVEISYGDTKYLRNIYH